MWAKPSIEEGPVTEAIDTLFTYAEEKNETRKRVFVESLREQGWRELTLNIRVRGGNPRTRTLFLHPNCNPQEIDTLDLEENVSGEELSEDFRVLNKWILANDTLHWAFN